MSTNAVGSSTSDYYSSLGLSSTASSKSSSLDQQDFLKLMTVQIQNQDPLKPMENTEFFSQIAQFSTVSGIDKLQTAFSSLATQLSSSQSLQAASLIGRDVLVESSVGVLGDNGLSGALDIPSSGSVNLQIRDASGAVVRTIDLGTQSAGQLAFNWNGTDAQGEALPNGLYRISATVSGSGGSSVAATTYAVDQVSSVALGSDGLNVELASLGELPFSGVLRIQ
eukprot:TRINITY_DN1402_c0_g1_i14.p1 TRINITY_DN1402_c0_g1~~TRINITY_DN1402_c0_g1_i14.p1  ORF type:complete len:224 (-),score=74.95 TRINITY_DN1402_c0_g1_i14:183-854(-)